MKIDKSITDLSILLRGFRRSEYLVTETADGFFVSSFPSRLYVSTSYTVGTIRGLLISESGGTINVAVRLNMAVVGYFIVATIVGMAWIGSRFFESGEGPLIFLKIALFFVGVFLLVCFTLLSTLKREIRHAYKIGGSSLPE